MNNSISDPMMQDILEQPELLSRGIREYRQDLTSGFIRLVTGQSFDRILFCGSGSVATAAWVLKYTARKFMNAETGMLYSGLMLHHSDFRFPFELTKEKLLLVCPGETGYTKAPVELARLAAAQNIPSVCTVRSVKSPLGQTCTLAISKYSGQERARPSTKGYTTGLLILTLCFVDGGLAQNRISVEEASAFNQVLDCLPESCDRILSGAQFWYDRCRNVLLSASCFRFVGYGANYGTAMEGALKFEEAHKHLSKAYELEEFLHGPMGAITKGDVIFFLFGEEGEEYRRMEEVISALEGITCNCIALGPLPENRKGNLDFYFPISTSPQLNPIELILPLQYAAAAMARDLGLDTATASHPELRAQLKPSLDS